jgi:hypothetical protein
MRRKRGNEARKQRRKRKRNWGKTEERREEGSY